MPVQLVDKRGKRNRDAVVVADLPPPAKGNRIMYDAEVKGFGVRVTAAGTKAFILNYRVRRGLRAGTERRYTIGDVRDWSTVAARAEASRLKKLIDQGHDPVAEAEHERQAPTVAALCDRYLAEHVDIHNKPRTRDENRRMVEQIIKLKLGRLKIEAVDHEDVARLHRELKRTPRQANHVVAVLSKMFNLAEVWKDEGGKKLRPLNSNPCRHIKRYPEIERNRYLSPDELERVGAALREMETEGAVRPEIAACIKFLALTGCRLSEAVGLTWNAIDIKKAEWTLPDAKAGARTVQLGAPALVLLSSLPRAADRVFVSAGETPKPVTANTIERAWIGDKGQPERRKKARPGIRDRAGIPDVRVHDLRHTIGTYAGAAGLNAFIVRDLLGHKTMAMTGRYVSRHIDPLRAAADAVAGQIAAALDGPPGEVVELPSRRA
jgi:integrase